MAWLAWLLVGFAPRADDDPAAWLQAGDRVVFFGDSITQNGLYVTYLDAVLRARYPNRSVGLYNHGVSSETISGTSEPDHDPRRPDAHRRFDRDVAAWKPNAVVACFGMNDGNYHPPDDDRFARFRVGVERLIERTDAIGARLVLLAPPPFDPYRRQVADPKAQAYGYKFPAIEYDQTLARFAEWERTLSGRRLLVVDLHTRINEHLRRRREGDVSFALAGDGVHPGETGHLVMALGLLDTLGLPEVWTELAHDVGSGETLAGNLENFVQEAGEYRLAWRRLVPIPRDEHWDRRSLEIENLPARLGREKLTIKGLMPGAYELSLVGEGTTWRCDRPLDAEELARGVDLSSWWGDLPLQPRSDALLKAVREARERRYAAWRLAIDRGEDAPATDILESDAERLRDLARPGLVEVRLQRRQEE
jgi:lysophospholipase L1-like esterase